MGTKNIKEAIAMAKSRAFFLRFIFLSVALFLIGCAALPPVLVKEGRLITPGTSIEAMDGSFVIKSGEIFNTPFYSNRFENASTVCRIFTGPGMASKYDIGIKCGGKRVRVRIPGLSEPLYGVLMFEQFPGTAQGPASRLYQLEIPQNYVEAAKGGRVSVVYEIVTAPSKLEYFAWILWLSDRPL
jgi:hypothetical protein